ncbi:MAG: hypothetical protein ACKV2T_39040 [Kofleriaceae bacterium]
MSDMTLLDWNELTTVLVERHEYVGFHHGGLRVTTSNELGRISVHLRRRRESIVAIAEVGWLGAFDPAELLGWSGAFDDLELVLLDGAIVLRAVMANATIPAIDDLVCRLATNAAWLASTARPDRVELSRGEQYDLFALHA